MHLRPGGIDIFYIDESHDGNVYVVTAISVPLLRQVEGQWTFVWPNHFQGAQAWRKFGKDHLDVPTSKELHAVKLASGRGNFRLGKHSFERPRACAVYRRFLESVDFLPARSIMSVAAYRTSYLYGGERLDAAMHALFQRMRRKCEGARTNALTFFDQGHPEYRKLYRKAQKYLPTGSKIGSWQSGAATRNLPLDMFLKDANEKNSKHCYFTQLADLVAYAAFLKVKAERGMLEEWQERVSAHNIYASIPPSLLNIAASGSKHRDAIVRI
jgi:hypothetical protein